MCTRWLAPVLATFLLLGCSHEATTRTQTARTHTPVRTSRVTTTSVVTTTNPTRARSNGTISVSNEIAQRCNIDFGDVDSAPKFDFDQSALQPQDEEILQQVAKCVTSGPLKGRALKLTGRADPRGEDEYNFVLGEHRADTVEDYLAQLGVDRNVMIETSRGKLDAIGTDEASWQRDRRVDITLQ